MLEPSVGTAGHDSPADTYDAELGFDLDAATIRDLRALLDTGRLTSVALTNAYLRRIAAVDPLVRAVILLRPNAVQDAAASDARRATDGPRSPLDGIPVLVKDNIDVVGTATTVGSRTMRGARPDRDAEVVRRLREAGAVILGKTNLSEWANHRSPRSTSGWSGAGGLTRNPYALHRNTSGSSSGSAAGVAASLTQVAIGTETNGSIVSPASATGVVGIKPTVGLVSRRGIAPITAAQDTAGPMARHVVDAILTLAVIAGRDEQDPATMTAPPWSDGPQVTSDESAHTVLDGVRLGLWRMQGHDHEVDALVDAAVAVLRAAGTTVVEVDLDETTLRTDERAAMRSEFRRDLDAYLAATPGEHPTSLADLVAANLVDDAELEHFGQELLLDSLAAPDAADPDVVGARARATATARRLLAEVTAEHRLDAVVAPTSGPAWVTTLGQGDAFPDLGTSALAAVGGSPHITVPMGLTTGEQLPVGLSFLGERWTDARLATLASAFERLSSARRPPSYRP